MKSIGYAGHAQRRAGRFSNFRLPPALAIFLLCLFEVSVDRFPVHDVPEGGDIVGAPVLVLQIVRVLPHVQPEDRDEAAGKGRILVGQAEYA